VPEDLDIATCRRALETSDASFDGRFVFGVTSTGVYCRPSCPSRAPKPENTRYFTTISRARAEGFRACKRCHPDAAVGAEPARIAAERAMALIEDGWIERVGVAGLAAELGYSERQLRRLTLDRYGSAPLALARAVRGER
jgi:AraC family transcriptional regulator of adaptative response / DNA-3-methyladenine glycosylase II